MGPCLAIALILLDQQPIPKAGFAGPLPGPLPVVAPAPPTSPTLVALNFKNQSAAMIALGLSQRTGEQILLLAMNEPIGNEKRFTLESPQPVPFWDAIDRFSAETHLQRTLSWGGTLRSTPPSIQFHGPNSMDLDDGPAAYVGPFRIGPVVVHEHFDRVFLKPKLPTNWVAETTPPFYADIPIIPELNLLSIRLGPLRKLEAVDELGQSLLDPKLGGEGPDPGPYQYEYQQSKFVRVPLVRPPKPSKRIAVLRGLLPLEVARRTKVPTTIVKLEGSTGKTFLDGELAVIVREFKRVSQGPTSVKLTVKLEGKRGEPDPKLKGLLQARLNAASNHQVEVVDAQGKALSMGGSSGTSPGGTTMIHDYTYAPYPPGSEGMPPTHLRIYRTQWMNWDMPFEFKDLPLP